VRKGVCGTQSLTLAAELLAGGRVCASTAPLLVDHNAGAALTCHNNGRVMRPAASA
jgi:hypothetical protein